MSEVGKECTEGMQAVADWFAARGWTRFPFQHAVWDAALAGRSGLLHAATGSGKTYAVWLAALLRALRLPSAARAKTGLRVLWITPMRALAADTARALQEPLAALLPAWSVGMRTGDSSSAERARQSRALPPALVTTPESLTLMLTRADARATFAALDMVIIDEWHELLGSKRGVQTQLALARLRRWHPGLCIWGLSATLGDLSHARRALCGEDGLERPPSLLIEAAVRKDIIVDTLLPPHPERFAWAGHLAAQMLAPMLREIEAHQATLVFTNTRPQAELWYQRILDARPDWAGAVALHHGSLDRTVRAWVEQGLRNGLLKAVVCTSSLDLGVDFPPVERVLQIGSAKGVARLLQRAGRSGHAPGQVSRVTLVPTTMLELLEASAAREAVGRRAVEVVHAPEKPLDVLVQHLVTVALGGGFLPEDLLAEVRTAWSYRDLSPEEWQWALGFVANGGQSLLAYPEYRRVVPDGSGLLRVPDAALARRHRMSIGTIVSDASVQVRFLQGAVIGTADESFIARLTKGDHFLFGGRLLEFVRVHEMTAYVRRATGGKPALPRWQGSRVPLSATLGKAMLAQLDEAGRGHLDGPELRAAAPLLALQARWSALPGSDTLLVEVTQGREGQHCFLYPFAGRAVHLGLASLLAYRVGMRRPATFSLAVNDYGLMLLSPEPVDWEELLRDPAQGLFSTARLREDVEGSLNASEMAQRRFREIARIAGLVFSGYPGQPKSARQLQASSSLFYEVLRKHDPGNLLLAQARREVLEQELEIGRLRDTLLALHDRRLALHRPPRISPFGFALVVTRLREKVSTEALSDRVARMLRELEKAADGGRKAR